MDELNDVELFFDKEDHIRKIAARADFVTAGPESGRLPTIEIQGIVHTHNFQDSSGFGNSNAVDDANINSVAFVTDKTAIAPGTLFGVGVSAESNSELK